MPVPGLLSCGCYGSLTQRDHDIENQEPHGQSKVDLSLTASLDLCPMPLNSGRQPVKSGQLLSLGLSTCANGVPGFASYTTLGKGDLRRHYRGIIQSLDILTNDRQPIVTSYPPRASFFFLFFRFFYFFVLFLIFYLFPFAGREDFGQ